MYNNLKNVLRNHSRDLFFAVGQIKQNPLGNSLTILAIAIALALPFGLYNLVTNIKHIGGQPTPYLSIYLNKQKKPNLPLLKKELNAITIVKNIRYISPQSGIKSLSRYSKLPQLNQKIKNNPLPGVFVLQLKPNLNISSIQMLANKLREKQQIQLVQINMTWVKRLHYIINFGQRLTLALTVVFGLAVVLIITNTIRLITQRHKEDIQIMRLFGATKQFIRRPLLYRGTLLGLLGGVLAWMLLCLITHWLVIPLKLLALSYQTSLNGSGISVTHGIALSVVSTILAFLGSWVAVSPYLCEQEE